jgi:Cellulase M and related proteins
MKELMKRLSVASGISGFEGEVRDIIRSELEGHVDEIEEDSLGNIIAVKRGSGPSIMLAAHMDEIGLMVRHIDKKGLHKVFKDRRNQ